jgi:hypothetical protein
VSWLPTFLGREHEDLQLKVSINPNLAGQSELAENAVFFKADLFGFAQFWLRALDGNATGGALCLATATVANIDASVFQRKDKLLAGFGLERGKTLRFDRERLHRRNPTPFRGEKPNRFRGWFKMRK